MKCVYTRIPSSQGPETRTKFLCFSFPPGCSTISCPVIGYIYLFVWQLSPDKQRQATKPLNNASSSSVLHLANKQALQLPLCWAEPSQRHESRVLIFTHHVVHY